MNTPHHTRPDLHSEIHADDADDPMRALLVAALDGNNDLARLLLAYFAVLTDDYD